MYDMLAILAHVGDSHGPPPPAFWSAWQWQPHLLVAIVAGAVLYTRGYRRLTRRSPRAFPRWRPWCYAAGVLTVAVAVLSPVAVYSEHLFFVHMIQHMLLLMVAPPLILLGAPLLPVLWGLPDGVRLRVSRALKPGGALGRLGPVLVHPWTAAVAYVATIAVWHLPPFYDIAQGPTLIHDLQHLTFTGTAILFWWPVVHPSGGRRRLSYGASIPYLLPPLLEGMLIGALLTFAGQPVYTAYLDAAPVWGFSVLDDQQLAGLIMWVPGSMLFMVPLIGLLTVILRQEERNAARRPPARPGARAGGA